MKTLSEIRQRLQMRENQLNEPQGELDKIEIEAIISELKWVLGY